MIPANKNALKRYLFYLLLGILLYMAFIWRLEGALLWRDEATTACWGREMAQSNSLLPRVWNGEQLMVQGAKGHDFNENFLPAMQSWLQFYIAAFSFELFGPSTFSARLLFALMGACGILFLYFSFRMIFKRKDLAVLAAGLCIFSLPYLHYARQARYYALVLLISAAIIYEIIRILNAKQPTRTGPLFIQLTLCGMLLFFSNYFTFGLFWISLGLSIWIINDSKFSFAYLGSTALIMLVALPFLVHFHGSFISRTEMANLPYLSDYKDWLYLNFERINQLFPVLLLLGLGLIGVFRYRKETAPLKRSVMWLWMMILTTMVLAVIINKSNAFLRYYLYVIPMVLILIGIYTFWFYNILGKIPAFLFLLVVFLWHSWSDIPNNSESVVKRQFAADNSVNGPMIEFLRDNVGPGESVMFIDNAKGMVAHFYLPDLKWYGILEARNPYNQPYKKSLPPPMFDDYREIDWVVVWRQAGLPPRVEFDHELIWNYRFGESSSENKVDKNIFTPKQYTITQAEAGLSGNLEYYDFYRRIYADSNPKKQLD